MESQVIANVANSVWQLVLAAFALAVTSALVLRAALDLGVRATIQRRFLRRWLGKLDAFEHVEKRLTELGSSANLYGLDYRQICGQLSTALQYEIGDGRLESPLVSAFLRGGIAQLETMTVRAQTGYESPPPYDPPTTAQRLSVLTERAVDDLQSYFTRATTRFVYDASVMLALVLLSILLESANTQGLNSNPPTQPSGWPPLALLALAIAYLVVTLVDAGILAPLVSSWTVLLTRTFQISVPALALMLVGGVLLVGTAAPELRTLTIFLFLAYGSAVLSPIFLGLLRRLTLPL